VNRARSEISVVGAADRNTLSNCRSPSSAVFRYGTEAGRVAAAGVLATRNLARRSPGWQHGDAAEVGGAVRHEAALDAAYVADPPDQIGLVRPDPAAAEGRCADLVAMSLVGLPDAEPRIVIRSGDGDTTMHTGRVIVVGPCRSRRTSCEAGRRAARFWSRIGSSKRYGATSPCTSRLGDGRRRTLWALAGPGRRRKTTCCDRAGVVAGTRPGPRRATPIDPGHPHRIGYLPATSGCTPR